MTSCSLGGFQQRVICARWHRDEQSCIYQEFSCFSNPASHGTHHFPDIQFASRAENRAVKPVYGIVRAGRDTIGRVSSSNHARASVPGDLRGRQEWAYWDEFFGRVLQNVSHPGYRAFVNKQLKRAFLSFPGPVPQMVKTCLAAAQSPRTWYLCGKVSVHAWHGRRSCWACEFSECARNSQPEKKKTNMPESGP